VKQKAGENESTERKTKLPSSTADAKDNAQQNE
jgi:hypothetical protein